MARFAIKSPIGKSLSGVTGTVTTLQCVAFGWLMAGMKSGANGKVVSAGTITDPGRTKKISVCVIYLTLTLSVLFSLCG